MGCKKIKEKGKTWINPKKYARNYKRYFKKNMEELEDFYTNPEEIRF